MADIGHLQSPFLGCQTSGHSMGCQALVHAYNMCAYVSMYISTFFEQSSY